MPHFIVEYSDNGDQETRAAHRAEHIAYRKSLGVRMPLAGPLLGSDGAAIGSIIIVEAGDQAEAERLATEDPLVAAGVLTLVSARPYRIAAMQPPAA